MARGFKKSISNIYNKMVLLSIGLAVISIIFGLIFLFMNNISRLIGILLGVVIIASGFVNLFKYLKRDGAKIYTASVFLGILYIALGVVVIANSNYSLQFVTICLGLYYLINCGEKLNNAFWLRKGNDDAWKVTLGNAILLLIVGFMLIFNTFATFKIPKLIGAFLMISGVINCTDAVMFKLRYKEIQEIFW